MLREYFHPQDVIRGKECPKFLGLFVRFCFAADLMVARMLGGFLSVIYPVCFNGTFTVFTHRHSFIDFAVFCSLFYLFEPVTREAA